MPRNPNKRRCQTPGCKAYAMRSLPGGAPSKPGQSSIGPSRDGIPANHCRSHLDHVLGRRNVGAPKGNLNAVKTGRHAHPLSKEKLESLSHEIAQRPNETPAILSREIYELFDRTGNSYNTIVLLARLSQQLLPLTADQRFHIELYNFIQQIHPESRAKTESLIWNLVMPLNPLDRLTSLREIVEAFHQKNNSRDINS